MVMASFTQMLLKKLPSALDVHPVKMALSIATIILSIKEVRLHSSHCPLTKHDVRMLKKISTRSKDGSTPQLSSSAWWMKRSLAGNRITQRRGKE
jgi:hypothetical protein